MQTLVHFVGQSQGPIRAETPGGSHASQDVGEVLLRGDSPKRITSGAWKSVTTRATRRPRFRKTAAAPRSNPIALRRADPHPASNQPLVDASYPRGRRRRKRRRRSSQPSMKTAFNDSNSIAMPEAYAADCSSSINPEAATTWPQSKQKLVGEWPAVDVERTGVATTHEWPGGLKDVLGRLRNRPNSSQLVRRSRARGGASRRRSATRVTRGLAPEVSGRLNALMVARNGCPPTQRAKSRARSADRDRPFAPTSQHAPGRIRTCDPRLRRPSLYPAELRGPVSTNSTGLRRCC